MPGGGGGGGGGGHVLTALCDHLGLQQLNTQVRLHPSSGSDVVVVAFAFDH